MTPYQQCEEKAKAIGQKFHELLNGKGSLQQKFFLEYPDVKALNIKSPILVLGLNPSGDDELSVGRETPNLFGYIPQNPVISTQQGNDYKELQKFCYQTYFKTYIDLFSRLDPPFNPIWYNKTVLQNIFQSNSKHLSKELQDFLEPYSDHDNNNYILFTDIVQYSKTNSKLIIEHLSDDIIKGLIKGYLRTMLDFIKPIFVLSANAAVSHFLIDNYNKGELTTSFKIEDQVIILASMLTGQRAMDVYSRQRLFNEMQDFLKKNHKTQTAC